MMQAWRWRLILLLLPLGLGSGCGGNPRKHLDAGFAALAQTNYVQAAHHFERVTDLDPQNASAYYNLGLAYWKLRATGRAADALNMARDLGPDDPRPPLLLAEVLQDAERWSEARTLLTAVRDGLPEQADIMTRLARLEYRAGDYGAAATNLEQALRLDPSYAPALYDLAVMARDQDHDPLVAMRYFSRFLSVATDQPRIDRVHEELARLRQPFRPAVTERAPGLAAIPGAPASAAERPVADTAVDLLAKANSAIAAQTYDEALVLLNQARIRDPLNADVLWAMAGLYDQQLGQKVKADAVFQDFVRLFPDDPRTADARNRLRVRPASAAPAAVAVSLPPSTATPTSAPPPTTTRPPATAAAAAPAAATPAATERLTGAEAWQRGLDAHAAKQWADAIRYYDMVLAQDPTFASAAFNIGVAQKAQGNLDAARQAFLKASTLDPHMASANYMAAVVSREQGQRDRAIDYAKRALATNPEDGQTHYLLGLLYRESLRYDLARYHFKRAAELAADRAAADKARAALASVPAARARP